MPPMSPALAKKISRKVVVFLMAAISFAFSQAVPDSSLLLLNSLQAAPDSAVAQVKDSAVVKTPDSLAKAEAAEPAFVKSVLYLGGGDNSPWFHLGVLYALESYSIPVDSIVGTSWGAFVGFLWAKGVALDDIQRILLDPYIANVIGHNEFDQIYTQKQREFNLPISRDGIPSLRHRFSISADTNGNLYRNVKELEPDSTQIAKELAKLRLQESLYRQPLGFKIPFAVEGCDSLVGNSVKHVIASLPLLENAQNGELCPFMAIPSEDKQGELALISVAVPKSNTYKDSLETPWQKLLSSRALRNLTTQPGAIIRAHAVQDTTYKGWIQAGFSAMERRLSEASVLLPRKADYTAKLKTVLPWFKFNPVFDSLSAEVQSPTKTYWKEEDTAMLAPEYFAWRIMDRPAYDSVRLDMQPSGDLNVNASVKPTFDVFAGGFGSNALGPNAYAGVSFAYVDQMEFNLEIAGFWGENSYGFRPRLNISRLWNEHWNFTFGYDLMQLQPLKSYASNTPEYWRIYSEQRSDLMMSVEYRLDALQKLSLGFLFGHRTFELDPREYMVTEFNTYPVSPNLRYELLSGQKDRWFATKGFAVTGDVGMQSIGLKLNMNYLIPIYWKTSLDARVSFPLTDYFTVAAGASGAVDAYHDEGRGYVYPKSFEYKVMNNAYRHRILATPWSSEWYDPDLLSHHYGLLRLNAGLHYGPVGAWIFGAYVRDYEKNPSATLGVNKFILEPALRFAYKSISVYAGMTRIVDNDTFGDLKKLSDYRYFIRVGNYEF